MTIRRNTLKKVSFITHISFTIIALLLITSCDRSKPPATAPLEVTVVKKIFLSLMDLSARQYGITPIDNLRSPQSLKDFVRSFSSLALLKKSLEDSFLMNGYSYSKTLNTVAITGLSTVMDFDGGPSMIILLTMPAKGVKRKEIDTIFFDQEHKDFTATLDLADRYLCCPLLDEF